MINEPIPEIRTIRKAIFAWEDEKEEKWLEQMAADGWKLIAVAPYVYKFKRSEPEIVVFRLDYKLTTDKDYQEYLAIFKDAGWELFATFSNWQYFKTTPENNDIPEIYNSGKAKAQKYRRLLFGLLPVVPFCLLMINPIFRYVDSDMSSFLTGFMTAIKIITGIILLFLMFAVFKIITKIRILESESKE